MFKYRIKSQEQCGISCGCPDYEAIIRRIVTMYSVGKGQCIDRQTANLQGVKQEQWNLVIEAIIVSHELRIWKSDIERKVWRGRSVYGWPLSTGSDAEGVAVVRLWIQRGPG